MAAASNFFAPHHPDLAPEFTDEELDTIYVQLSVEIRQQLDLETRECLAGQNYSNIRQGSATWLRVQRKLLQMKVAESEQREIESEMGV